MYCDNCAFYRYEWVEWEGRRQRVKLCQADVGDICPAADAEARGCPEFEEYVGDSAYDRALTAGLHPTEIPASWRRE